MAKETQQEHQHITKLCMQIHLTLGFAPFYHWLCFYTRGNSNIQSHCLFPGAELEARFEQILLKEKCSDATPYKCEENET